MVLLSGDPGIGKTRLAAELAREAHAAGATVLYGRNDAESLVPYQPFVTAVQHFMAHRDTLDFPPELAPELSELARLVPALRRHLPELREPAAEDGETRRYRLFEAVTRVLARVAADAPTVLILDDLHWADTSTALLLSHLLQDVEPTRLLVLGTIRASGEHRAEELTALLTRLYRDPGFERVALAGLDDAETGELVAATDRDASGSFILRLHEGTDGNPFFIKETLRSLADEPELRDDTLRRVPVPEGVKELIGTRLARLTDTTTAVLTAASVVGREFRLEVLETLLDEPVERIITALEAADEAGLVREVADDADRFAFTHALVRETLYERQSASRRVRMHYRIAQALDQLKLATPAELAYHYVESRHLDREGKAVDYSEQAAVAASEGLADFEAKTHYAAALERLQDDEPRRARLLIGLGTAAAHLYDPDANDAFMLAAEIATREHLTDVLAEAALGRFGNYAHAGAVDYEAIELLERALAALGDEESPLTARLLTRLANALHFAGQPQRVDQLTERALELARRGDDPLALLNALESRHTALLLAAEAPERLAIANEFSEIAERIDEPELLVLGLQWRLYDTLELADMSAAVPLAGTPSRPRRRARPADLPLPRRALERDLGDDRRPPGRGAGPDRRTRTSSASAPAAPRWSSSPPASTPGSPTAPARWATSRPRSPSRSRATRSSSSTCRCSRSPTCRPGTGKPRPRSSSASPPTTSPRSRATCCGWARWPCSRTSARSSATASGPASSTTSCSRTATAAW